MNNRIRLIAFALLLSLMSTQPLIAGKVRIAVAANFTAAMREIAANFEKSTKHTTVISYGSTGKLYAQIRNGAPFEVFLAADQRRPQKLEIDGLASERFTYAIGKLVLWSSDEKRETSKAALKRGDFKRVALANPKTAPYGTAAITTMQRLGIEAALREKWVIGDSIAQARQFVATANAELGFIALAQIALDDSGNRWDIPQTLYDPIRQDAVLLDTGLENPAAAAFVSYLQSPAAKVVIDKYGYATE
ncbi:MAG: molybdate ABC transporter substrate-binding protein [Candidatus Thiodiazotropha sp. (ex Dulcina madagascariensis)]|nr:molybdate ABC transporter substrate-binding protein [Candidatus Thiodiazotropha sp. (ex Dulcina madagascariensis)]